MKKILIFTLMIVIAFTLASCSKKEEEKPQTPNNEKTECQVAMITDGTEVEDKGFNQIAWKTIKKYCDENDMEYKFYRPDERTDAAYVGKISEAVAEKAELIILAGNHFETTAFTAQATYPEVNFLLIDGVPHDAENIFVTGTNTISIVFAEEESGFMAGYAAVKDGNTKIGFIGGEVVPATKRYGYGFIQGAAQAATELKEKVEIKYTYSGTSDESEAVTAKAKGWFQQGTQVIFVSNSTMCKSVTDAIEDGKGEVIGVDVNQSYLSDNVLTSAKKRIDTSVENVLKDYGRGNFVGGVIFNYGVKNDGISLEMKKSKFKSFGDKDYEMLFKMMKSGKLTIKKDTDVGSLKEIAGDSVTVVEEKIQ